MARTGGRRGPVRHCRGPEREAVAVVRIPDPGEGHREPTLRFAVAESVGSASRFLHHRGRKVGLSTDIADISGSADPSDRLSDAPHGPTVEAEVGDIDDRLVAQFDRVQAMALIDPAALLGAADDGRSPTVPTGVGQPGRDRPRPRLWVAERVARGEAHSREHAVGDRGLSRRREDQRLVGSKSEVPQRVAGAMLFQECAHALRIIG